MQMQRKFNVIYKAKLHKLLRTSCIIDIFTLRPYELLFVKLCRIRSNGTQALHKIKTPFSAAIAKNCTPISSLTLENLNNRVVST